jgi:hypothetical protein
MISVEFLTDTPSRTSPYPNQVVRHQSLKVDFQVLVRLGSTLRQTTGVFKYHENSEKLSVGVFKTSSSRLNFNLQCDTTLVALSNGDGILAMLYGFDFKSPSLQGFIGFVKVLIRADTALQQVLDTFR